MLTAITYACPPRYATYPDVEIQVAIRHRLDVESNGRYRRYDFANLSKSHIPSVLVLSLTTKAHPQVAYL